MGPNRPINAFIFGASKLPAGRTGFVQQPLPRMPMSLSKHLKHGREQALVPTGQVRRKFVCKPGPGLLFLYERGEQCLSFCSLWGLLWVLSLVVSPWYLSFGFGFLFVAEKLEGNWILCLLWKFSKRLCKWKIFVLQSSFVANKIHYFRICDSASLQDKGIKAQQILFPTVLVKKRWCDSSCIACALQGLLVCTSVSGAE